MSEAEAKYLYDSSTAEERTRLRLLEKVNDPPTIDIFERLGVGPGWRCLEIGGGGGSIARWLCERVGRDGKVVATDLDTRFLDEIDADNLEVRRHDILEDELEKDAFDLVHSRFLLEHLPDYAPAVRRIVEATRPGGWVVVEDVDFAAAIMSDPNERFTIPPDLAPVAAKLGATLIAFGQARGIHAELGRRLPGVLVDAGLVDVGAEGRTSFIWSGTEDAELGRLTVDRVTKIASEAGLMTPEDRVSYMELFDSPNFGTYSPLRFGAWGRKPV